MRGPMTQSLSIAVIDYEGGNLASAARAAARAAELSGIAASVCITNVPDVVLKADRLILPGQGAFADCAHGLDAQPGLKEALLVATRKGTPFLGICVGMQLMAERGLEHGTTPGLGWIKGEIAPMQAPGLRLPQMGWNELNLTPPHPLTEGPGTAALGLLAEAYALHATQHARLLAITDHGVAVPGAVSHRNEGG